MRRAYAKITVLALGGTTLLDDGPFLVAAAVAAATALVLCGGRRLLAATNAIDRRAQSLAADVISGTKRHNPGSSRFGSPAPSTDTGLRCAAEE